MSSESHELVLYGYWRSSAAYRVRIALNMKQLPCQMRAVHLVHDGGQQHGDAYRRINPQQLVPTLMHGQRVLRQSLAIIEYLDEVWPDPPLLPATPRDRARVRAMADLVACDIHPVGNLRVLQYLGRQFDLGQAQREQWSRHWIEQGFAALEAWLAEEGPGATFCDGDSPGLADICLVPQVYNARRWNVNMDPYPRIRAIDEACRARDEFQRAAPEMQPDAPAQSG